MPKQTNNPPKVASNTATLANLPYLGLHQVDNLTLPKVALYKIDKTTRATSRDDNIMPDRLQDNVVTYDVEPLRILQVLDKDGQDITKQVLGDTTSNNPVSTPITNHPNLPTTKNARQKANDLAIELVGRINSENLSRDDLTTDELTALVKFTGGGGLINADGTKGSDYEYYTPKELASGVWDIAKELGFNGGKVLDPSAGTGIFTATSPDSALMDN